MPITAIAAIAQNQAIGRDNKLPWRLPADLQFFKKITSGHTVLMGRKSFESIGKPLPNRRNWVLTRQKGWNADGVEVFNSLAAVLDAIGKEELMVIGGGEIYQQTLPFWNTLYLTQVQTEVPDADAFFPVWNADGKWMLTWEEAHIADEKHLFPFTFQKWELKP